jgi:acyl-CoA thioesterase
LDQTEVWQADGQPGSYRATLSDDWNCPIVPHGGVLSAVALRAMAAALDAPEQHLRTVTVTFVEAVKEGDLEIEVNVLRRGRSMSQVSARVRNAGAAQGAHAVAVYGSGREGFAFTELEMPEVPSPEDSPSWRNAPPGFERPMKFNFWDHVESRMARGHLPWVTYEPTVADRVNWFRFMEPPLIDGRWDPLAVVAMCDTMPGAVAEKLGSNAGWIPPSLDLTVHLLGTTDAEWILGHNRAHHAGDGYASVETTLWDPEQRVPLAYSTQMMFFSFIDA